MENKENVIEYLTGDTTATVTFTNGKDINKMRKLHETRPEDFEFFIINADGSLCATVPRKWVKISPPKQISEERKQAASERFRKMWRDKQS